MESQNEFPVENDNGNVEYKRHVCNKDIKRKERLATQMQFRLKEGNGECIYKIGVEDDGTIFPISSEEFDETLFNLNEISKMNNCKCNVLNKIDYTNFYKTISVSAMFFA